MSVLTYVPAPGEPCLNQFKAVLGEILNGLIGVKHGKLTASNLASILGSDHHVVGLLTGGQYQYLTCDWLYERICMLGYKPEISFDTNKGMQGGTLEIDFKNVGEQFELPNLPYPEIEDVDD